MSHNHKISQRQTTYRTLIPRFLIDDTSIGLEQIQFIMLRISSQAFELTGGELGQASRPPWLVAISND